MRSNRRRLLKLLAGMASGGVCFQLGGCAVGRFLGGLNPCGTVLNCDFREFEFVNSGIDGPGVDIEEDPFCTFPPFCTAGEDPIFGGLVGAP